MENFKLLTIIIHDRKTHRHRRKKRIDMKNIGNSETESKQSENKRNQDGLTIYFEEMGDEIENHSEENSKNNSTENNISGIS